MGQTALSILWVLLLAACSQAPGNGQTSLGLRAEYFLEPNFSGLSIEQIQSELAFDWGSAPPALGLREGSNFSVRWSGFIEVDQSGEYTFYLTQSGQAKLWIDDRLVMESSGQGKATLKAGTPHHFVLEFVKTGTEAALKLEWSAVGLERQVVSRANLSHQHNSNLISQTYGPQAGQNLLLNPGFDSGTGNWRLANGGSFTTVVPGRDGTGRAASTKNYAWVQQDIPYHLIQPGTVYTLEAYGRALGNGFCKVGWWAGSFRQELTFGKNWERRTLTQTLPSGTTWMIVYLFGDQNECQFDDLFLGVGGSTPPPPPSTGNLLVNGGWEQSLTGWQVYNGSATPISPGRSSNSALQASNWAWVQQNLPFHQLSAGRTYQFSGWVRPLNGASCSIGLLGGLGSRILLTRSINFSSSSSTWTQRSFTQSLPGGMDWLVVWLQPSSQPCQYDDFSFSPTDTSTPLPANPTNFRSTAATPTSVSLAWDAVSGATGYSLERKTDSGAYTSLGNPIATNFVDNTASAKTTYTYRLRATNSGGSSNGVELSVTTPDLPPPPATANVVQILYGGDSVVAARSFPSSFSQLGGVSVQAFTPSEASQLYATMLANLIGRYPDLRVEIKPVSSYSGLGASVVRVFYIGSIFDETLPEAFLRDAASNAPITWLGYNLWKLADRQAALGLNYRRIISASTADEVDSGYNRVRYRDYLYQKLTRSGSNPVPNEIIEVESTSATNVVQAWAERPSGTTDRIPYAVQSNRFWYIADIPFAFAYELDRYLVFADLLGVMLGRGETCQPRAMIRLEDVQPTTATADLKNALDVLERLQIPFGMATIPLQVDGVNNTTVRWVDRPDTLEQLRRGERIGGRVLEHGYTHQYKNFPNPSGVSGTDWEFWDIVNNRPLPDLTADEAIQRIETGKQILRDLGLTPAAWVTPHYMMPPAFYAKVNPLFPRFFERRLYQVGQNFQGQFFPYPVRDVTGALLVPENTNFVGVGRSPADIVEVARANRALRCPWIGSFFHPFLLSAPAAQGGVTPQEFEKMLTDIRALGYTFVDINSVSVGQ